MILKWTSPLLALPGKKFLGIPGKMYYCLLTGKIFPAPMHPGCFPVGQQDTQVFPGTFGHIGRTVQLTYLRWSGSTYRDLWISQLHNLSPSVSPWTLRKPPTSAACTWDSALSVTIQDSWPKVKIRTKADLKINSFTRLDFGSTGFLTTEWTSSGRPAFTFTNPRIILLVLSSFVTRE